MVKQCYIRRRSRYDKKFTRDYKTERRTVYYEFIIYLFFFFFPFFSILSYFFFIYFINIDPSKKYYVELCHFDINRGLPFFLFFCSPGLVRERGGNSVSSACVKEERKKKNYVALRKKFSIRCCMPA